MNSRPITMYQLNNLRECRVCGCVFVNHKILNYNREEIEADCPVCSVSYSASRTSWRIENKVEKLLKDRI
jgi:hypothetical protein